jgi:hypothetical protein
MQARRRGRGKWRHGKLPWRLVVGMAGLAVASAGAYAYSNGLAAITSAPTYTSGLVFTARRPGSDLSG